MTELTYMYEHKSSESLQIYNIRSDVLPYVTDMHAHLRMHQSRDLGLLSQSGVQHFLLHFCLVVLFTL